MNSLWILHLSLAISSTYCVDLDINLCALNDVGMKVLAECCNERLDQEIMDDWRHKLSSFKMTEVEVMKLICRENNDMGSVLMQVTIEEYVGYGEERDRQLAISTECLEAAQNVQLGMK